MSRTIIARGAALAAATMLALTACGGTDEAPAEQQPAEVTEQDADTEAEESDTADEGADDAGAEDTSEAEDAAEGTEESETGGDDASAGDDAAGATAGTVVEIGTEFTDEETGDVITIVSAVRNNSTEYYMASDNPDGEMIYLEVKVTAGDKFGGVISQQDFFLDDGGENVNYASTADDELIAAGHNYFDGTPRSDGEGTGYIPIYVETTADTLKGAYLRPEMKILGEDATVPEFRGEFEIPAA